LFEEFIVKYSSFIYLKGVLVKQCGSTSRTNAQLKPGRKKGGVLEKNYLQQRDKVSTCMVKIGQESLTWKAKIMKLLWLTAGK
jgi:hypothetical protein